MSERWGHLPGPGASGLAARHAASAGIRHTSPMTAPAPHDDQGRAQRESVWLRENAEALESSNRYVERHGLPLRAHWAFGDRPESSSEVAAMGQRRTEDK